MVVYNLFIWYGSSCLKTHVNHAYLERKKFFVRHARLCNLSQSAKGMRTTQFVQVAKDPPSSTDVQRDPCKYPLRNRSLGYFIVAESDLVASSYMYARNYQGMGLL